MNRASQIRRVVDEYREALLRESNFDASAVCLRYPDLMPDLAQAFEELRATLGSFQSERTEMPAASASEQGTVDYVPQTTSLASGIATSNRLHYMGEYRLDEMLGEGSFGQVWRGTQLTLSRPVAIKLLKREHQHPDLIARFRREARMLARLQHPHIVSVLEVNEHEGFHYIAMEFVEGTDLKRLIQQGLPTPQWSAQAMKTVALAMAHAHAANLIHRDLKPANILVDSKSQLKVTDFGLAKQTTDGTELTVSGAVVGTIAYMAPEQASGRADQIGPAADIYAIGATLYHLLSGRPPFPSDSSLPDLAVLDEVRYRDPARPSRLRPDRNVPRDLETICLKCLQKDPRQRYATAAALAADLDRFLEGEPILARPVSVAERGWRMAKKRPLVAGLTAALVLVTLVGSAWAIVLSQRTKKLASAVQLVRQEKSQVEIEKAKTELERESAKKLAAVKTQETAQAFAQKAWQEYIADMQEVGDAWQAGNLSLMRELLAKHARRDDALGPDYRGLEWFAWDYRLRNTSQPIPKAKGRSAAISKDNRLLAMATEANATLWDVQTGALLQQWEIGRGRPTNAIDPSDKHQYFDRSVALSPSGKLAAATTFRVNGTKRLGSFRVWETATGDEKLAVFGDQGLGGRAIAFSPDERLILVGGYGYKYKAWNLDTKQEEQPIHRVGDPTEPGYVKAGTVWSGESVVWDMAFWGDRLMLRCDLLGPAFPEWQREGNTPRVDMELPFRLGRNPLRQSRTMFGHTATDLYAAVRNDDDTVDIHQPATPRANGIEVKRMPGGEVTSVTTADHLVAAAGRDHVIRIWNVQSAGDPQELRGSEVDIEGMAFSPDRTLLVTFPGTRIWRLDAQANFRLPLPPKDIHLVHEIASPDKSFALHFVAGSLKIVAAADKRVIADLPCQDFIGGWFSPNDERVALTIGNQFKYSSQLWDLKEGQRLATLPMFGRTASGAAFSSDGRHLAGHHRVWDAGTGELVLDCGNKLAQAVAFSPSNQRVAFADSQQTRVWDLAEKREIARLPRGGNGIAFCPGEQQLVLAGNDSSVWDLATQAEIPAAFGKGVFDSVAIARDGRRVYFVRGGDNGELRIFAHGGWNQLFSLRGRMPRHANELDRIADALSQTAPAQTAAADQK